MASGKRWTRDELFVVLNLYHKLRFGQFHARNPVVVALARKLSRTAGSVAMKLGNLASLDPVLRMRGIKGLVGASNLDRSAWDEFHENLTESIPESEEAIRRLFNASKDDIVEVLPKNGVRIQKRWRGAATEAQATTTVRRGQEYFREVVLNNFDNSCGVCRLSVRELLVASHILPWASNKANRLEVSNGLCLSRLHDAAFDRGLITFDENLRLLLSPKLKTEISHRAVADNFGAFAGEALHLPDDATPPDPAFLATHRRNVFRKT